MAFGSGRDIDYFRMAALVLLRDHRFHCALLRRCRLVNPSNFIVLLLKVTGIPYAEKQALRSRGDDYRAYQAEVSPFIPLPPSKRASSLPT